jgi:integrase
MAHGGARKGGGRKAGALTTKARAIAEQAIADGITPLEVMLHAMRATFETGDLVAAASLAKDAAPYAHPRLAAVEQSGPDGGAMTTEVVYRWKREDE